jgi:hypothetical protein
MRGMTGALCLQVRAQQEAEKPLQLVPDARGRLVTSPWGVTETPPEDPLDEAIRRYGLKVLPATAAESKPLTHLALA